MFPLNEKIGITCIIDAIKLVHAFTDLGLSECKIIAEIWAEAYGYRESGSVAYKSFSCSDMRQINKLGSIAKKIVNGQWQIVNGAIVISKNICTQDVLDLL
jgi:hypothetical protein